MKKYNHKIKAFTLSEIIVVLMITIIVVGLAFSVLNLVQKQMSGMSENYQKNTELQLLQQALWMDFGSYASISIDHTTQIIRFENEIEHIDYLFEHDLVLRGKDTFHLELAKPVFYYEGIESSNGVIDAVKLNTTLENGDKTIFIHHKNAAAAYMN